MDSKKDTIKGQLLSDVMSINSEIDSAFLVFMNRDPDDDKYEYEWRLYVDYEHMAAEKFKAFGEELSAMFELLYRAKLQYNGILSEALTAGSSSNPEQKSQIWKQCVMFNRNREGEKDNDLN